MFAITYDEAYLGCSFYRELRGRVGYAKTTITNKTSFRTRAAAVKAAERELADRVNRGWQRVSRVRLQCGFNR